ncbi:MAG: HEPN-type nucleotidyltransferase, antibiotic resistance related protein [candidate division TM6 bacterium GW2011_GWF2_37_49]|nr:MAG: HEPN-type nucleotidyltransferase, antibiotic resistance related protein [candidate division TM6 bacterium GW2011_GWF2_37_49]
MLGHNDWLRVAKEDFLAAKGLIKIDLYSASVYHSQQSAEKTLKAYLVFKKHPLVKTHDLIQLLEICMSFDAEFRNKFDAVDFLNPFASKFRYPTEFNLPEIKDAELAAKHAESIMRFVLKKIAEPETGQTDIFVTSEKR